MVALVLRVAACRLVCVNPFTQGKIDFHNAYIEENSHIQLPLLRDSL
jgi:hypothetical protein